MILIRLLCILLCLVQFFIICNVFYHYLFFCSSSECIGHRPVCLCSLFRWRWKPTLLPSFRLHPVFTLFGHFGITHTFKRFCHPFLRLFANFTSPCMLQNLISALVRLSLSDTPVIFALYLVIPGLTSLYERIRRRGRIGYVIIILTTPYNGYCLSVHDCFVWFLIFSNAPSSASLLFSSSCCLICTLVLFVFIPFFFLLINTAFMFFYKLLLFLFPTPAGPFSI